MKAACILASALATAAAALAVEKRQSPPSKFLLSPIAPRTQPARYYYSGEDLAANSPLSFDQVTGLDIFYGTLSDGKVILNNTSNINIMYLLPTGSVPEYVVRIGPENVLQNPAIKYTQFTATVDSDGYYALGYNGDYSKAWTSCDVAYADGPEGKLNMLFYGSAPTADQLASSMCTDILGTWDLGMMAVS